MWVVSKYSRLSRLLPYTVAFGTCWAKGQCSDVIAQTAGEGRPFSSLDVGRNLRFALFSGAYTGIIQHFIYNVVYSKIFGDGRSWRTVIMKVGLDNFIHVPFLYIPVYYTSQSVLKGNYPVAPPGADPFTTLEVVVMACRDGLRKYREEAYDVLRSYYMLWTPVQLTNFKVVPTELRIAFIASASFFWLIILSFMTNHEGNNQLHHEDNPRPVLDYCTPRSHHPPAAPPPHTLPSPVAAAAAAAAPPPPPPAQQANNDTTTVTSSSSSSSTATGIAPIITTTTPTPPSAHLSSTSTTNSDASNT